MTAALHRLLVRQLARHTDGAVDGPLAALVADVDRAYRQADGERELLERSLDLMSQELLDRNQELTTAMRQSGIAVWSWQREPDQLVMVGYGPVGFPEVTGRGTFTLAAMLERVVAADRHGLVLDVAAPTLRPGTLDVQVRVHDGDRVRWVRVRGQCQGAGDRWIGVWIDVTDEVEARLAEQRRRQQIVRQHQSLQRLAQLSVDGSDAAALVERIAYEVERTLEVDRTQILLLDDDGGALRGAGEAGPALVATELPAYFAALARDRTLAWDDLAGAASSDPRATEARSRGAGAMLDAPCRIAGRVVGVVTCAQAEARSWLPEEQAFVASVADVVSLVIEGQRRRRAEAAQALLAESLRQAQKMESIGLLAGGVAHDFNNLLTPIMMCAEMVRDELGRTSRHGELMETVVGAAVAARDLVAQLLAFSRKQVLRLEPVDLGGECRRVARLLERTLPENVEVAIEIADEVPLVRADPGQLQQVLLNLAINARDAMPGGGRLTLRAAAVPGEPWATLAVIDSGCGMGPDIVPHIFEPFFTTKGLGRGTGLGLSTVYGIVQQHGGTITVDSEVGTGTRFELRLPISIGRTRRVSTRPVLRAAPSGSGTVLVVDDEPAVRSLVTRVLRRDGFGVLEADGPEAALAVVAAHAGGLDLVLTDVSMPGMNGVDLVSRLTVTRPELRVLFISGYDRDGLGHCAQPSVDARLLRKPFSVHDLLVTVREMMSRPRLGCSA